MIVNDNVVKVKYSQTLGKTGVRTEEEVKNIVLKNESLKHISPKQLFEQKQDESKVNALISEFEKKNGKIPPKRKCKTLGCNSTGNVKNIGLDFHYSKDACPLFHQNRRENENILNYNENQSIILKENSDKLIMEKDKLKLNTRLTKKILNKNSLKHVDHLKSSFQLKNSDLLNFFDKIGYSITKEGNIKALDELDSDKNASFYQFETNSSEQHNQSIVSSFELDYDENVSIFENQTQKSIAIEQQPLDQILEEEDSERHIAKINEKNSSTPVTSNLVPTFQNYVIENDQRSLIALTSKNDPQTDQIQKEQKNIDKILEEEDSERHIAKINEKNSSTPVTSNLVPTFQNYVIENDQRSLIALTSKNDPQTDQIQKEQKTTDKILEEEVSKSKKNSRKLDKSNLVT